MSTHQYASAKETCENLLLDSKRYNIEHKILPSENKIVDRLIDRGPEMAGAYDELVAKLGPNSRALSVFLDLTLSVTAFWNPERMMLAREQRRRLVEVNVEISDCSNKLADFLKTRREIENSSSFSSNTHYSMCNVIEAASATNYLFRSHVGEQFRTLHGQYDAKYWPSLEDCIREIGGDAKRAEVETSDPITASATISNRGSLSDFFRAMFSAISENRSHFPDDFSLTDNSWATLATCVLDLDSDTLVDSIYVKQLRQRLRNQS